MARGSQDDLDAALRRLDAGLDGVRRAVERASEVTFPPVDLRTKGAASPSQDDAEFKRRLADAMNEWHEDFGWATTMPDDVRSELVSRVRSGLDDERRKG